MAIQGERTLWHAGRKAGVEKFNSAVSSKGTSSQGPGGAVSSPTQLKGGPFPPNASPNAPAKTKVIGPHNPIRQTLRALGAFATHSGAADGSDRDMGDAGLGRNRFGETSNLVNPAQARQITCFLFIFYMNIFSLAPSFHHSSFYNPSR